MYIFCIFQLHSFFPTVEDNLAAIRKDFESIKAYLLHADISVASITKLQQLFAPINFHQSCVRHLSVMLENICHKSANPDATKVGNVKCL